MNLDLTAFVLTQNNIRTIKTCLDSLSWCPQVVVVDSFSSDGTLKVLESYPNVTIYQHQYTNAREQRIWGIAHVKTMWTFIIDSDEICTHGLKDEIIRILTTQDATHDGFIFQIRTMFMGKLLTHSDYISSKGKRLVKTEIAAKYKQSSRVHASILLEHPKFVQPAVYLIHDPIGSLAEHFTKMIRYASWQAQDMHDRGMGVHWWHFLFRPGWKFLHFYVVKGGFRDGMRGLLICIMAATSILLKYALLAELIWKEGRNAKTR